MLVAAGLVVSAACGGSDRPSMPAEKVRDLANALYNRQLYRQAIEQYRHYLDNYDLKSEERAKVLYTIGDIYLERLRDYENALAEYLKVKHLYPESGVIEDVNKKIVECLERLERSADAQQALQETTALEPSEGDKSRPGEVVARIGRREITMGDLQHEINQLPPYLRSQVTGKNKKLDFLKQYIATELFYDSAKRKGLDKDKEVLAATFQAKKNIMVQKFLDEEISKKVSVEPSDIELYYKAHRERYAKRNEEGEIVEIPPLEEVRSRVMQDVVRQKQQEAYEQLLQRMMRAEAVEIHEDQLK